MLDPTKAFPLEMFVTDCKNLVNKENICRRRGHNGKGEASRHPGRIGLYVLINNIFQFGKIDDFKHIMVNF